MTKIFRFLLLPLLLVTSILNVSCREEEFVMEGTTPEERLVANTNLTTLLRNISLNDGSMDNIIDGSSCFSVLFPVAVSVNESEFTINDQTDLTALTSFVAVLVEAEQDYELVIDYPITLLSPDFTEFVVNGQTELWNLTEECDVLVDHDIECVDFQYPINASLFNPLTQDIDVISIMNDRKLFDFLDVLRTEDIVNLQFPITLSLADEEVMEVFSTAALESFIENVKDDCDEQDDNNFHDNGCSSCDIEELQQLFALCPEYRVSRFTIDGENIKSLYDDLSFTFSENGDLTAISDTETYFGTWLASETLGVLSLEINLPGLSNFNTSWSLERISNTPGILKITLLEGEGNMLRFQDTCLGVTSTLGF